MMPHEQALLIGRQRAEQALHQRLAAGLRSGARQRTHLGEAGDRPRRPSIVAVSAGGGSSRRLAQPTPI